jgi:REP element-mobilizing transposase RayT
MQPWQVRLSSDGRHPLFPDEADLRDAVRVLVHTAGREIALFCIVDDHVHVVLYCEREVVTWRARSLCRVIRARAATPVSPSFISPVKSRAHMLTLVGYILDQTGHHGLQVHPALWSGSCFPDLIGARQLPGLVLQLTRALPRLQPWEICSKVGLKERDLQPLCDEEVRTLGAARILSASTAVLGVGPRLDVPDRRRFLAWAMTAQTAGEAGLANAELGWLLRCTDRHVLRLMDVEISDSLLHSVRVRLALEEAVAAQQAQRALRRTG